MNASYRLNTCKSRGSIFLAIEMMATGARVSNTYPTCLILGDSLSKERLISDSIYFPHGFYIKEIRYEMGMRSISLLAG